ncbi:MULTISPECIES: molybdopterin-guanine dinucleotide biosynthesis protein MobC [Erwinia]|uniref:molybdopterin-guanine dinucleotide biosynthesis protein MobC n=1 Tax=Erwinia TaxID=551 RepID=UPI0010D0FF5D|nr:molybdopterin-guanine dinucleotide biosynthesis protein MobC [Erwinia aphidicola]MCP2234012.1 hypothetical protein [Erwinia aphidicola]
MSDKKWYSVEDVELAKTSLDELPDLSKTRLTKSDVLEQLKDKIIELADNKGYSVEDIRSGLDSAGIQTSVKAIREILNARKKSSLRAASLRKKSPNLSENSTAVES